MLHKSINSCSVTKSCLTLYNPMDYSTPGFPVLHCLPELVKFMSVESVMLSNHLILCRPFLLLPSIFPRIRVFFHIRGQSIGAPASGSVLPMMTAQGWFPLGLTGLISLLSSSVQSCPTLCDPMDYSTLGLPVHHQLPEFTQMHVHWVGDAIQPSPPLSSSPPAFNLSQHQSLFQWVSSSHQVAKGLKLQHQSLQ